jgi:hypothetical protein
MCGELRRREAIAPPRRHKNRKRSDAAWHDARSHDSLRTPEGARPFDRALRRHVSDESASLSSNAGASHLRPTMLFTIDDLSNDAACDQAPLSVRHVEMDCTARWERASNHPARRGSSAAVAMVDNRFHAARTQHRVRRSSGERNVPRDRVGLATNARQLATGSLSADEPSADGDWVSCPQASTGTPCARCATSTPRATSGGATNPRRAEARSRA